MILVIAESEIFKVIHRILCAYLGFSGDCYLHFHALSSRRRRQLAQKVAENTDRICRYIKHIEIIIVRGRFKEHSNKIAKIIISLREKFGVDRIVLGSDFLYYMRNSLNRVEPYIIDDRSVEVQVADILANTYRRRRRISGSFNIRVF